MTPRTYRPSRLDRVLWSLQLVIVVVFVGAFAFAFVSGMAGGSATPSNPGDVPIGPIIGVLFWVALIVAYVVSARGVVRTTADGIDVVPYIGRVRHVPWSHIPAISVGSTSPYAGGMFGAGSWVEVDIALRTGRGTGLQATRRPKSQAAAVEQVRNEIAAELAAHPEPVTTARTIHRR
jgi:hypothetical protein